MNAQAFRNLLTQQPFQPFRVVMSSGQSYEVRHPEMAFTTKTNIFIGVGDASDGVAEDGRMLSLLHVTAVEPLVVSPA